MVIKTTYIIVGGFLLDIDKFLQIVTASSQKFARLTAN